MGGDFGNGSGLANLNRSPVGHDVWGKITHFRGVVIHHISPFEQRVFAGWISKGFPNTIARARTQLFRIGIPALLGLMLYNWMENAHERGIRKQPQFYIDEYNEYLASDEHKALMESKEKEEKEAQRNVKKPK